MSSGAAAPAAILSIDGIVKRFGPQAAAAVDGVSLELARGEFFALLGPSGCGKTTLLRLLAGFERPDAGRIAIGGADMNGVAPYARPVNMMFQSYALFPHMSVAENVGFGLRQERVPRPAIAERVAAMLDLVQLSRLAERKPQQLSGGERQRVALARALVKEPMLLLLDEPLAALDRKLREETRYELVRIQERVGITFLMVTHDQEEAMSMAGRIAVMQAGRIAQLGAPHAVYEAPASRFVAEFLGGVNLFTGRVAAHEGGILRIVCAETGAALAAAHPGAHGAGAAVTLAVRPEKIALAAAAPPGADNAIAATVEAVSYRGEVSTFRLALAGGKSVRATVANSGRGAAALRAGDTVWLAWSADAAMVLER